MWLWVRQARKEFGFTGGSQAEFNTAAFQTVVSRTLWRYGYLVRIPPVAVVHDMLLAYGYELLPGGCHWRRSA